MQSQKSFRWMFWTLALSGLILDQGSKYLVFANLYNDGNGGKVVVVPGAFYIVAEFTSQVDSGTDALSYLRTWGGAHIPHVNHGALFGLGHGDGTGNDSNFLFTFISMIAGLGIIIWSTRSTLARDPWLCFALGLILAGTLGNLYDRVVFTGVRDFFWFFLEGIINWPVFNAADCFLVCGASTLLIQALFFTPENLPAPVQELTEPLQPATR